MKMTVFISKEIIKKSQSTGDVVNQNESWKHNEKYQISPTSPQAGWEGLKKKINYFF